MKKETKGCVGLRLQWSPDEIEGWPDNNATHNEFTAGELVNGYWDTEINDWSDVDHDGTCWIDNTWDAYLKWSQQTVTGEIFQEDTTYVYIMLDSPMAGEYFSVAYDKTSIALANIIEHQEGT